MSKRRPDDGFGDDILAAMRLKKTLPLTFMWFMIWLAAGGGATVGFGLMFAWAWSVGLFDRQNKNKSGSQDKRGYQQVQGGETEPSARARLSGEVVADQTLLSPQRKLHSQVIAQAKASRTSLVAAASVASGDLGSKLRNMVAKVKEVESSLDQDPSRLADVQRLFTYYLPATADLLLARGTLAEEVNPHRLAEIDAMIGKLNLAFTDFAERVAGHDARTLEIDLRLLDQALTDEFFMARKA